MKFLFLLSLLFSTALLQAQSVCPENIDFETGSFANWQCFTGSVEDNNNENQIRLDSSAPVANRHEMIDYNTAGFDYYGGFLQACPYGGRYAVKLGNDDVNNGAEGISYEFQIPPFADTFSLTYYYAVVFQDPDHDLFQQPRFFVSAYDVETGRVIDCASYDYVSNGSIPGFQVSTVDNIVLYKEWTPASIDFAGYSGRRVRLEFKTADCTKGGHFGYAYLDVGTGCGGVMALGALCEGADSVVLTAPYGFEHYTWYNSNYTAVIGNTRLVTLRPLPAISSLFHVDMIPYPGYGCRDTADALVTVLPIPDTPSAFNIGYCRGDVSTRLRAQPWPGYELVWYSSENGTGSTSPPTPSTAVTGVFNYWVSQRSLMGRCEGPRKMITVTVSQPPIVSFTINSDRQCLVGNDFLFTSTTTSTAAESVYSWNLPDSSVSGQLINHHFLNPGRYPVTLSVTNPSGCKKSLTRYVSIIDKPVADFSYPPVICENQTNISLQNSSYVPGGVGQINAWWWQIGGTVSNVRTPPSFIGNVGSLPVKLVVTTTEGCRSDTAAELLEIYHSPLPAFTTSATCNNEIIRITDKSAMPAGAAGNVVKWNWTYNGIPFSSSQHPEVFLPAGNHQVELQAESDRGCKWRIADTVLVVYPKPSIQLSISDSCVFRDIVYRASTTSAVAVDKWLWNFGDGIGEGSTIVNRKFEREDNHVITLIGQTIHSCKDTIIRPFTIYYNRSRAYTDTITAKDEPVQLTTTYDVNMQWYKWTPSTGLNSDHISNPVATYDLDQVYELNTMTKQGCDSRSRIFVRRYKGPELYVAGAFTPNGDGKNEILHVFPVGIRSFEYFSIYNRAGVLLFKTYDQNAGWNGMYKGAYVDPGNYVYVARAIDYKGNVMMRRGNVVLLR